MTPYAFDTPLTLDILQGIATQTIATSLSVEAKERVVKSSEAARVISERQAVYGRSTGVGANRLTTAALDPDAHGLNLIRSHACDTGEAASPEVVRATLAIRLSQLVQGGSGIDPEVAEALSAMLEADALPELRMLGSIGTGDLPALAGIALALVGERPTTRPFAALERFGANSALPFISSSAFTLSLSASAVHRLTTAIKAQQVIFTLSAIAAAANHEAFSSTVARTTGLPSAEVVAQQLRALTGTASWSAARIQDPYAFRGYLQSMGVLQQALVRLSAHIETLINTAQENPLFAVEEGAAYHHGSFYQAGLAHELDAAAIALAQTAPLLTSRLRFLNDDAFSGLPRFLAPLEGGTSGTMMVEYLAASAMGDLVQAASPSAIQSTTLSCGVEDDATFASTGIRKLTTAIESFEVMLACELVMAVRALRLSQPERFELSKPLARAMQLCEALPAEMHDRDLRNDISLAKQLLPSLSAILGTES
ncbi:aromatic amino acid lyase [Leucobacter chinensis]|uniref:aromatic amino acid lyase n=1 Tax=Leucobacter chinensis TaxID=2851010 RepID=UPI001C224D4D